MRERTGRQDFHPRASKTPPDTSRSRRCGSPRSQVHRELNTFYREHLARRATRGGDVGMKTRRERRVFLERFVRELHEANLQVRRLKNLREKHVWRILEIWTARHLQPATLASYVSHLRWMLASLGKEGLLQFLESHLDAHRDLTRRRSATLTDRSEAAVGVDFAQCLARARELDEYFACQLLLIKRFGLRSAEAWLFRPHLAEVQAGQVQVAWGTKGGRPRVLPIAITPEQREALDWARRLALTRPESMIPRGYTLPRWRRRYYYLCERVGLTRRALRATPHSFRHGVLLDQYAELGGEPAPVRGGTLSQTDPWADQAARQVVAETAGHSRPHVSSAYLGSPRLKPPGSLREPSALSPSSEHADAAPGSSEAAPERDSASGS